MIYDCFTFFNELDLLEIRLNILNDYVDKFVLVEATRTQNNKEKKLYYEENKERFAKFKDKVIHGELVKLDSIKESRDFKFYAQIFLVFIIRCFTCLIPNKKLRHELNDRAKNIKFNKRMKNITQLLAQQKQYLQLQFCNKDVKSKIKILHVSTYDIECGIAEFTKNYIDALSEFDCRYNGILPFKYEYLNDIILFKNYVEEIIRQSESFDLVSIQHEYSFWKLQNIPNRQCFDGLLYKKYKSNSLSYSLILLDYLLEELFKKNKKINIVWHTDFNYILKVLQELKIISKKTKYTQIPFFRFFNSENLEIIVMNEKMIESLNEYSIPSVNVKYLQHPVKKNIMVENYDIHIIKEKYNINCDDIVIGTFGFVNKLKGIENVINALKYLPSNYKYIHLGGVNPNDKSNYIFDLENLINKNMLVSRAVITGFIKNEEIDAVIKLLRLGLYVGTASNSYASGAINNLLANKVPLLTSDIAQFSKIKSEYNCLEICDNPTDPKQLAQNIIQIINNDFKIQELKANSEKYIDEHSFVNFAKNTLSYWEENNRIY